MGQNVRGILRESGKEGNRREGKKKEGKE